MRAILPILMLVLTPIIQAAGSRPVSCRLLAPGGAGGAASVVVQQDDGGEAAIPLSSNTVSREVTCLAKDNVIRFLSGSENSPVAEAMFPDGMKSVLLIFYRQGSGNEDAVEGESVNPEWKVLVVDDSAGRYPKGGGLIANCNPTEARYSVGSKQEVVPSCDSRTFGMPEVRDEFNMASVKVEVRDGEHWKLASESSLRFLPGIRYMIISYPDLRSGRSRVEIVRDNI